MTGTTIDVCGRDPPRPNASPFVIGRSSDERFELIDMTDRRGMVFQIAIDHERNSFEECLAQERPDSGVTHVCELVLMDRGVLIDVGAHIGTVSIPLAKAGNSVFAFEMASENVEKLEAGRQANGLSNLFIEEIALSDHRGAQGYVGEGPWCSIVGSVQRKVSFCDTLDAFVTKWGLFDEAINELLIKIDVEGHELSVVTGAQNTIERLRPLVLYESILGLAAEQSKATAALFREKDYQLFCVFEAVVAPMEDGFQEPFLANILAIPTERVSHILPRIQSGMELRNLTPAERLDHLKLAAFSEEVVDHPIHAIEVLRHWSRFYPELYEIANEIRTGLSNHTFDEIRSAAMANLSA